MGPIQPLPSNSYAKHVQDALPEYSLIVTEHPDQIPLPSQLEFHRLSHILSITLYPQPNQQAKPLTLSSRNLLLGKFRTRVSFPLHVAISRASRVPLDPLAAAARMSVESPIMRTFEASRLPPLSGVL